MSGLSRVSIARGVSAVLPHGWSYSPGDEEVPESTHWLALECGNLRAEISCYSLGKLSPSEAIAKLKFNVMQLVVAAGFKILDHDKKHPSELLIEDTSKGELVFYEFRSTNPVVVMSAAGVNKSNLNELRFISKSIEIYREQLLPECESDELELVLLEFLDPISLV